MIANSRLSPNIRSRAVSSPLEIRPVRPLTTLLVTLIAHQRITTIYTHPPTYLIAITVPLDPSHHPRPLTDLANTSLPILTVFHCNSGVPQLFLSHLHGSAPFSYHSTTEPCLHSCCPRASITRFRCVVIPQKPPSRRRCRYSRARR